jgi:hypothetical protein
MHLDDRREPPGRPRGAAIPGDHHPRPDVLHRRPLLTARGPDTVLATRSAGSRAAWTHALAATPAEQLPTCISYEFTTGFRPGDGRPVTVVRADGVALGDPLTDAAHVADYYRLHDVFHLSYATLLDWSPVTRALLQRKRPRAG